jgi:protein-tyrosine phosphatase
MRDLIWDGVVNVRDLGGLPTVTGGATRLGAIIRSANLDNLTAAGWDSLVDYGVRTVIDLRNDHELHPPLVPRPSEVALVRLPLDHYIGPEWYPSVCHLDGTPRIYTHYLQDGARVVAALLNAVASAEPGGVLVHCAIGRDRTGFASMLLLHLAGVQPDAIAADYELSHERLIPFWPTIGLEDQQPPLVAALEAAGTTLRESMLSVLSSFEPHSYLAAAGVNTEIIQVIHSRLISDAPMIAD